MIFEKLTEERGGEVEAVSFAVLGTMLGNLQQKIIVTSVLHPAKKIIEGRNILTIGVFI